MAWVTRIGDDGAVTTAPLPQFPAGASGPVTARGASTERYLRGSVVALQLGAAAIHFAMAPDHFGEYWLFGVFFVASAWLQIGLAAAVVMRPSRRLYEIGLVLQVGIVALWAVTRTSGLPIGPDHWTPEPIAPVDALCSGFEVAAAFVFLALLMPRISSRVVSREVGAAFVGAVAVLALGLTSYAVTPSGLGTAGSTSVAGSNMPGMNMGSSKSGGNAAPTASTSSSPAKSSPAKATNTAATVPTKGTMQMEGMTVPMLGGSGLLAGAVVPGCSMKAMHMAGHRVGGCVDGPVTVAQEQAAESLVVRTRAALVAFPTLKSAYAAGYKDANVSGPLYHLTNYAYLIDGKTADPSAIESLVYFKSPSGASLLLGGMYVVAPGKNGPTVGGALTTWHEHTNLCVSATDGTALNPLANGKCPAGSAIEPTGQMLHVWAVPYEGGPFADIDGPALTKAITDAVVARGGMSN